MNSWIESANAADSHFPVQNLPYGVFSVGSEAPRCAVAIGDSVLDLAALESAGLLDAGTGRPVFDLDALNAFMSLGEPAWSPVRARLTELLSVGGDPALERDEALRARAMHPASQVRLHLPFRVAGYTDFYSSRQHAENVGTMFRGADNALPPNWLHMPIAYNGRASSVVVSGTPIRRPLGQRKPKGEDAPVLEPSRRLDIELELGAVVGVPSALGTPLGVAEAERMIFGFVLLNDWSARDVQAWEYQPLGPFQAKAFGTSISPWVVPRAALEPFRVASPPREPPLLPYLHEPGPMLYDLALEVQLRPEGAARATVVSRTNARHLYYSAPQQLAHHAIGGCPMSTGDLLGSGTISGPGKDERGSLLELTWGGEQPLTLATGQTRTFLEDGDSVTLTGWAQGAAHRVGFGTCEGRILPAPPPPA